MNRPLPRPWHHQGPLPTLIPHGSTHRSRTPRGLRGCAGDRGPAESSLPVSDRRPVCWAKPFPVPQCGEVSVHNSTGGGCPGLRSARGYGLQRPGAGESPDLEGRASRAGRHGQLSAGVRLLWGRARGPGRKEGREGRGGGVWRDVRPWAPRAKCPQAPG